MEEKELLSLDERNLRGIKTKISFQEYLVDILGGLFPGILFLLGLVAAIGPPILSLSIYGLNASILDLILQIIKSSEGTPSSIWFVLFVLFTLLAYIIGHIFYRRDIKEPDRASFNILKKEMEKRLIKKYLEDQKLKNTFQNRRKIKYYNKTNEFNEQLQQILKEEIACTKADECEFPYPYFADYLRKRKLTSLIKLACWCDDDKSSRKRSKTYINILKIRLRYFFPEKCQIIIKNEGHVRLASSAWYVSNILKKISIAGLAIILLSYTLNAPNIIYDKHVFHYFLTFLKFIPIIMSPLTILLMSIYFLKNIAKFIHYQRLREIFYVLETANTAFFIKQENALADIIIEDFPSTNESATAMREDPESMHLPNLETI